MSCDLSFWRSQSLDEVRTLMGLCFSCTDNPYDLTKQHSSYAPPKDIAGGALPLASHELRRRFVEMLGSHTHAPPPAVLDNSAQILFLTEMMRGMSLTLRMFFEKKVTVRRG